MGDNKTIEEAVEYQNNYLYHRQEKGGEVRLLLEECLTWILTSSLCRWVQFTQTKRIINNPFRLRYAKPFRIWKNLLAWRLLIRCYSFSIIALSCVWIIKVFLNRPWLLKSSVIMLWSNRKWMNIAISITKIIADILICKASFVVRIRKFMRLFVRTDNTLFPRGNHILCISWIVSLFLFRIVLNLF